MTERGPGGDTPARRVSRMERLPGRRRTYAAAVAWPLLALLLQALRLREFDAGLLFGDLQGPAFLLGFALVGACSELAYSAISKLVGRHRVGRMAVAIGYVLAVPAGYLLGVIGPLTLATIPIPMTQSVYYLAFVPLGIGFWGTLPLVAGCAVGAGFARLLAPGRS